MDSTDMLQNKLYLRIVGNRYLYIFKYIPQRTFMNCIHDKEERTNGRWTALEHQNFLLGLQLYGKNWKKIQELVLTRTGSQIRSHAQKHFLKSRKMHDSPQNSSQPNSQEHSSNPVTVKTKQQIWQNCSSSFFISIIGRYCTNMQKFDFWGELVDITEIYEQDSRMEETAQRKNSFVSLQCGYEQKHETVVDNQLNCVPFRT